MVYQKVTQEFALVVIEWTVKKKLDDVYVWSTLEASVTQTIPTDTGVLSGSFVSVYNTKGFVCYFFSTIHVY